MGPIASCYSCGREIEAKEGVGRRETCDGCGADLHCCRNCKFYDKTVYNECREPQAETVLEKEQSNFCDWFELGEGKASTARDEASEAKRRLEALFKKG